MIIRKNRKNESVPAAMAMAGKQVGKILVTKAIEALVAKAKEKLEQGIEKEVVAADLAVDLLNEIPASVEDNEVIDFVEVVLPEEELEGCGKKAKKEEEAEVELEGCGKKEMKKEDADPEVEEEEKHLMKDDIRHAMKDYLVDLKKILVRHGDILNGLLEEIHDEEEKEWHDSWKDDLDAAEEKILAGLKDLEHVFFDKIDD